MPLKSLSQDLLKKSKTTFIVEVMEGYKSA